MTHNGNTANGSNGERIVLTQSDGSQVTVVCHESPVTDIRGREFPHLVATDNVYESNQRRVYSHAHATELPGKQGGRYVVEICRQLGSVDFGPDSYIFDAFGDSRLHIMKDVRLEGVAMVTSGPLDLGPRHAEPTV